MNITTVAHIPAGSPNRSGLALLAGYPQSITFHHTGNTDVGADAEMHMRFAHNGGGIHNVSFHYTVDDRRAIQLLPLTERAWHAGDGPAGAGNGRSIAIEGCVNRDGSYWGMLDHAAELAAGLRMVYGLGRESLRTHYDHSGKWCPSQMLDRHLWTWWCDLVDAKFAALRE